MDSTTILPKNWREEKGEGRKRKIHENKGKKRVCFLITILETTLSKSSTEPVFKQTRILLNSHTVLWRHASHTKISPSSTFLL